MEELPLEMCLSIFEFVGIKDLVSFATTCRSWKSFFDGCSRDFVREFSCEYGNAPKFIQEDFGRRSSSSLCSVFVDIHGKLQGEAKIAEDSFEFLDGKLHGKYRTIRHLGQDEWIKESAVYKHGNIHGLRTVERKENGAEPEHLLEESLWENGVMLSHSLKIIDAETTTTFSSCGERTCDGEVWFCYKKTAKTGDSVTEIEYIDGERHVTVDGILLEGPREKGEAWSQCCEEHQRELPDSIC